jgi:hypothetical protein
MNRFTVKLVLSPVSHDCARKLDQLYPILVGDTCSGGSRFNLSPWKEMVEMARPISLGQMGKGNKD